MTCTAGGWGSKQLHFNGAAPTGQTATGSAQRGPRAPLRVCTALRAARQTSTATCHLSHDEGQYQCNLLQRAAVPPTIATPKAHLHVCIPLSQLAEVQQHGIPQNYDCKFTKCLYKALQIQPCVFTSQSSSRTIRS